MAQSLADTITSKTPAQLYAMVESGWNMTVAEAELKRRKLPTIRPKQSRRHPRGRGHAKGRVGVSNGFVDLSKVIDGNLRKPLPGAPLDPWYRRAMGRA